LKLRISTPSSARFFENGGMLPGTIPPISAWCARLAVKNSSSPVAASCTGVTTVTSGRCEPPRYGSFVTNTSPGAMSGLSARIRLTVSLIAPRCTGMCGALTTRSPVGEKIAQLKSSRSFTLVESAVLVFVIEAIKSSASSLS
jgi:hypothetical protein